MRVLLLFLFFLLFRPAKPQLFIRNVSIVDVENKKPYEKEIEWVHQNMEGFLRRYTAKINCETIFVSN